MRDRTLGAGGEGDWEGCGTVEGGEEVGPGTSASLPLEDWPNVLESEFWAGEGRAFFLFLLKWTSC